MKDKELIKQEIERRIKNLEFSLENNCVEKYSKLDILGNITTLKSLLQFIDSLSEEPTSEDLEEACDNYYDETWDEHGGITMVINNCHDIWFPSQAMEDFFKAGAEWQKREDQESIKFVEEPDLDEAAKEHAANLYGEDWMKNEHVQDNGFKAISNFKFGAGWHKQQMMKGAVDATVHNGLYGGKYIKEQDDDVLNKALEKYNPGDKVKIIIVKEKQ